ncbi:MAG TPA: hypothetical protein VG389_06015 [Myxococcota bacterium]|jgi:hypothetical protein|nr:hypothetical protein [Myxococcota bacterium]
MDDLRRRGVAFSGRIASRNTRFIKVRDPDGLVGEATVFEEASPSPPR